MSGKISAKFIVQSAKFAGKNFKIKFGFNFLAVFLLPTAYCSLLTAQSLPIVAPQTVGMSAEKLNQIDGLVEKAIADKKMPGAVVLVGHKGKIVFRKAYGNRALIPAVEKMTVDTIFDIASLTKAVATTTFVMKLVEDGKIRLNNTIGDFIPEIEDADVKKVTIQQLLTHTGGFRPDFDLREKWTGRGGMLDALKREKLRNPAGTKFVYSDIGFIVLGEIASRIISNETVSGTENYPVVNVKGKEFSPYTSRNLFEPLLMMNTGFFISENQGFYLTELSKIRNTKIAPTENIKGQNSYLGSNFEGDKKTGERILRGQVHDPTAFRMGGVAGHAGLFSTADDLARFCQMLLNGGILDGKRVLSANTIARMTAPYVVSERGDTRGLGWDMNTSFSSNRGDLFPLGSFGHTGFTGTSVWIDRVSQTFVIFLSNRVHPDGKGDVGDIRAKVATVAASAIEDTPIEAFRLAESVYWSQVSAQIPKFIEQLPPEKRFEDFWKKFAKDVKDGTIITRFPLGNYEPIEKESKQVLNGIDVLEKTNFRELENKRVGLVTNHTGRNLNGKATIDVLNEAKNLKLVALFAPEHGIRGELDEEGIKDSKDEKTGLPVYSLYKDDRRPKPEQLQNLDAIVYDIQDVGARFYTYTATLRNVLEEAAKAKIPVYILDRPNPINGETVEGSLAEEDKLNFIAAHTIPVRYGLTIGELGMMMNSERKINADVKVVKMENWSRRMWFDETNQTWINPSPNMRSLTEATLYSGIGLLETTNVSVGRGTDTPFEIVGAPWIDGRKLAEFMNAKNLKGVRFVPIGFTPKSSVFTGENCGGINIVVTDRNEFEPVKTGFELATALRKLYPNDWQVDKYSRLLVNAEVLEKLKANDDADQLENSWKKSLEEFKERRASFLLYK